MLADKTSLTFVYQVCAFLPAVGLLGASCRPRRAKRSWRRKALKKRGFPHSRRRRFRIGFQPFQIACGAISEVTASPRAAPLISQPASLAPGAGGFVLPRRAFSGRLGAATRHTIKIRTLPSGLSAGAHEAVVAAREGPAPLMTAWIGFLRARRMGPTDPRASDARTKKTLSPGCRGLRDHVRLGPTSDLTEPAGALGRSRTTALPPHFRRLYENERSFSWGLPCR